MELLHFSFSCIETSALELLDTFLQTVGNKVTLLIVLIVSLPGLHIHSFLEGLHQSYCTLCHSPFHTPLLLPLGFADAFALDCHMSVPALLAVVWQGQLSFWLNVLEVLAVLALLPPLLHVHLRLGPHLGLYLLLDSFGNLAFIIQ